MNFVKAEGAGQHYYNFVTDIGVAHSVNAILLCEKITLTHFAVGDGGGRYYEPNPQMTSLVNEVWRGPITKAETADNQHELYVSAVIPADIGPFIIREMAIFDEAGHMIAISNTADIHKMTTAEGLPTEIDLCMHIFVSNTEAFKFEVDPTIIIATRDDIQKHNNDPNAHDNRFLSLETESELVRIDHGLGTYPQVTLGALQYGLGVAGLDEGPLGGTDTAQYPARAVYHSSRSLTVMTTKSIAQLGTEPTLHKMNDREYTVTWPDNQTDSLYIRLI